MSLVVDYVTEEVTRQGHDVTVLDGIERVAWMLEAWCYALRPDMPRPEITDAIALGSIVEQHLNREGIRRCGVMVGSRVCPRPERVMDLLTVLWQQRDIITPLEFYKGFEEIHPFVDGNGRTGKVLLNWLAGTLLKPVFPPADLWGRPIRNP